jgi:ArsR family transcriptional regulator, arsenate/arsenite/antimonite-responsive transcriptional repressor
MYKVAVILMAVNVKVGFMDRLNINLFSDDSMVSCCSPLSESELSEAEAQQAATIFGALGDPVRLRMLSLIAAEPEVCSCALEVPLGKSQPTISHHTKILAEAGLIEGEKRGRWMWWHIVPSQLNDVARILTVGALAS